MKIGLLGKIDGKVDYLPKKFSGLKNACFFNSCNSQILVQIIKTYQELTYF